MDLTEYQCIVDRYLDDIYRTVLCYCHDKETAEDAVQNAFLKLWTSKNEDFADEEHIRRWLIRVSLNECKNVWKSFWHRNKISFEDLDTDPSYRNQINFG